MKIASSLQRLAFSTKRRNVPHLLKAGSSKLAATERGFTLVEMIVAVGLFSVVMVVCIGALLSLVNANRKAQALQAVINNLNVALDGVVRNARMGNTYHGADGDADCGGSDYNTPHDCPNGGRTFAFEPYGNSPADDPWVYRYDEDGSICGQAHSICRSKDGGSYIAITASDVSIDDAEFFVVGTENSSTGAPSNTQQPKVIIVVKGTAGIPGSRAETTFHIQATAVQRLLDL